MSWKCHVLWRLEKDSFWKKLCIKDFESQSLIFDPFFSAEQSQKDACKNMTNPEWKEIYSCLLQCKTNLIVKEHINTHFCPIIGGSNLIKNRSDWANDIRINDIFRPDSNFKQIDEISTIGLPPQKYQYEWLNLWVKSNVLDVHRDHRDTLASIHDHLTVCGKIVCKTQKRLLLLL